MGTSELWKPGHLRFSWLATFFVSMAAHGWMALNRGIFWDGWVYQAHLLNRDWDSLFAPFRDAGYPAQAAILWPLSLAQDPGFAARLISLALVVGLGLLVLESLVRTFEVARSDATWVACLTVAYPAWHVAVALNVMPIVVSAFAFFAGAAVGFESSRSLGARAVFFRIASHALFLIAFVWRSFLVFYAGYLLLQFLRSSGANSPLARGLRFILTRLDLLLLPVAYWIVQRVLIPQRGSYATENQFVIDPASWVGHLARYAVRAVAQPFAEGAAQFARHLTVLLAAGIALAVIVVLIARSSRPTSSATPGPLIAAGGLGLFLAALPYALVGKSPLVAGWTARHALLAPVPLALLVTGVAIGLGRLRAPAQGAFLVVSIMTLVATSATQHLGWLARAVRDDTLSAAIISEASRLKDCGFFVVDDRAAPANAEPYRIYEYSQLLQRALGDHRRLGIDVKRDPPELVALRPMLTRENLLDRFEPGSCRVDIVLTKSDTSSDLAIALRYLWNRATGGSVSAMALAPYRVQLNTMPL